MKAIDKVYVNIVEHRSPGAFCMYAFYRISISIIHKNLISPTFCKTAQFLNSTYRPNKKCAIESSVFYHDHDTFGAAECTVLKR